MEEAVELLRSEMWLVGYAQIRSLTERDAHLKEILLEHLATNNPVKQRLACQALSAWKDDEEVRRQIQQLQDSPSPLVRRGVARLLQARYREPAVSDDSHTAVSDTEEEMNQPLSGGVVVGTGGSVGQPW